MMDAISLSVTYFAVLLGFGVLLANLLKKHNIPDTFFLMLLGLLFGPTVFLNPFVASHVTIKLVDVSAMGNIPDFLRTLALIMALFTGAFNLNFKIFKRYSKISLKLAFLGVVFNAVVLGFVANQIFMMPVLFALLLGAVISDTDNNVIFAFEKVLGKSRRALTVLKVESILNTPISILIPFIVLDFINLQAGALIDPLKYLSNFWMMITIGVGTGLIVGLSLAWLFKNVLKEYGSLMLFSMALITYALAVGVGGSDGLAVAVCGLVAGNFAFSKKVEKEGLVQFQDQFSEMLRISVFTLLGAQVTLFLGMTDILLISVFFIMVVVIRPLFLILVMGKTRKEYSRKDVLLMSLVAPRGLSAAAMIPIVAAAAVSAGQPALAGKMINIVFMVILLSVMFSTIVAKIGGMERFNEKHDARPKKDGEDMPPVQTKDGSIEVPTTMIQEEKSKGSMA